MALSKIIQVKLSELTQIKPSQITQIEPSQITARLGKKSATVQNMSDPNNNSQRLGNQTDLPTHQRKAGPEARRH